MAYDNWLRIKPQSSRRQKRPNRDCVYHHKTPVCKIPCNTAAYNSARTVPNNITAAR